MKHIFCTVLSMVIFQVICPAQSDQAVPVGQSQSRQSSQNDSLQRDGSLHVTEQTDGMSSNSSLRRQDVSMRHASGDALALDRHGTFYELDSAIASFNRTVSQSRHYKSYNAFQVRQEFTPEFHVLCARVRSFQDQGSHKSDSRLPEPLDSSLVKALLMIATVHELDKDAVPSPMSCSLSRPAGSFPAELDDDNLRNSVPPLDLRAVSGLRSQVAKSHDSAAQKPGPNEFPAIPVVVECISDDSDLEDCL